VREHLTTARPAAILLLVLAAAAPCSATTDSSSAPCAPKGLAEFAAGVHAELRADPETPEYEQVLETALEFYRSAASNLTASPRVAARIGFLELTRNNPQGAQLYFARAAGLAPRDTALQALAAQSCDLAGEPEKGTAYLENVLRDNPSWLAGYDTLARMYKRAGMWARAASAYTRLAAIPGMRSIAYERLGETYMDMAREHLRRGDLGTHLFATRRAMMWFNTADRLIPGPSLPSIMLNRARCYAATFRFRKAALEYKEYLKIRPGDAAARRFLALAQRSSGDLDAAIETLQDIIKATPHFLKVRHELIQTLIEADYMERACEFALETAALFPEDLATHSIAGRCLVAVDRDEEALKHLERALELDPRIEKRGVELDHALKEALKEAALYLGLAHVRAGNDKTAMHFFGMALELDPEDADANNNLGYTTLETGGDVHTALRLIIRAVRIRPDCGEFLDSLGWVYHRLGRTLEAAEVLRNAIDILPRERAAPEIHDHLGIVYHALGRVGEARKEWMRALEINPDYHPAQLHLEESYRQNTDTR